MFCQRLMRDLGVCTLIMCLVWFVAIGTVLALATYFDSCLWVSSGSADHAASAPVLYGECRVPLEMKSL